MKVIGIKIEMAQRAPYNIEEFENFPWEYRLFGHFDYMSLRIVDSPLEYEKSNKDHMNYYPYTQKIYAYAQLNEDKMDLVKKFVQGNLPHAYIALISVKFRRQFLYAPFYEDCSCVESFLETKNLDYCVIESLGLDDIHILISTPDPSEIVDLSRELQDCKCSCFNNAVQKKQLYTKVLQEMFDYDLKKLHGRGFTDLSQDNLLEALSHENYKKYSYGNLKLIKNCTDIMRLLSQDFPIILQTKIVVGCLKDFNCDSVLTFSKYKEHFLSSESFNISKKWFEERHEKSRMLFKSIRKNMLDFPFLQTFINELEEMHAQGCHHLFYARSWNEFVGVSKFFASFFKQLYAASEILISDKELDKNEKKLYADKLAVSIEVFLNTFYSIFHKRILLDNVGDDNARPSIYSDYPLEELIDRYTGWITNSRTILESISEEELNNGFDKMRFLIAPEELYGIYNHNLFSLAPNDKSAVIMEIPFNTMLDVSFALPILVHEVARHTGIVYNEKRVATYLGLVANFYARSLTRDLCNRINVPLSVVQSYTDGFAEELLDFFRQKVKEFKKSTSKIKIKVATHLSYTEFYCQKWLNQFLDEEFEMRNNADHKSKFKGLLTILDATVILYRDNVNDYSDADSFIQYTKHDKLFVSIKFFKRLIEETYADLVMIKLLDIDDKKYIEVLKKSIEGRKNYNLPNNEFGRKELIGVFEYIRESTALMHTKSSKELDVSDMVTTIKSSDLSRDLRLIWKQAIPYLQESGEYLNDKFKNLEANEIRELYSYLTQIESGSLRQIQAFLYRENGIKRAK